uniref:Uncharacterized protein n=1 Tax=Noccaea caerulescens TaxID=107243 RepID=A0A1J3JLX8_NOCCA
MPFYIASSYVTRVHEDSHSVSHGLRRQVGCEFSTDNTAVTMRPGYFSPDATVVATILLCLSLVDVSHPLSLVPCYLLSSVDSFDLNKGCVWVLVRLRPFVSEDGSSNVESDSFSLASLHHFRVRPINTKTAATEEDGETNPKNQLQFIYCSPLVLVSGF